MKVKNVKHSNKKIKRIPLDREVVAYLGEFFGRDITNTTPEASESELTYSVKQNDQVQLDYVFNRQRINQIKKQLNINDSTTEIQVGRLASKFWLSLIVFAFEQADLSDEPNKISGSFKYSDVIKLWNVKKSGAIYSDIRNLFISLAAAKFVKKTLTNEKTEIEFYNLINYAKITEQKSSGAQTKFYFELDERALSITADWIRFGKLSLSQQADGYISIPISDLSESSKNSNYINFRERLRLYPGGEIKAITILRDWGKLTEDNLKRREFCYKLLNESLERAKNEKEIKSYKCDLELNSKWRENWHIKIVK